MLDLVDIKTFCAVVDCGGLTAAADQLGQAKSTMSRRLSQLEARVGQPLLSRQSNRLQVTEAGRLFESYARQILSLSQQGLQVMDTLREEVSGELVVCCHPFCAESWFIEALASFLGLYPAVSIRFVSETRLPANGVSQGEVWCWLGGDPDCGLRYEPLAQLPTSLYASPDYLARLGTPQHPRDLVAYEWVAGMGGARGGELLHHPREGEYLCQPTASRLLLDDVTLQGNALRRGLGIAVLPDCSARAINQQHPDSLRVCLPDWRTSPWSVGLLYPYGRQPRKVSALLAHLRNALPPEWCGSKLDKPTTRCEHDALY